MPEEASAPFLYQVEGKRMGSLAGAWDGVIRCTGCQRPMRLHDAERSEDRIVRDAPLLCRKGS